MSNIEELRAFQKKGINDLGDNSEILLNLVKRMKNKRFMDLGVRYGASSTILSFDADVNNNQVCGCDIYFDSFEGSELVNKSYERYQSDSVTLGKNWNKDPFDIIFVDTLHTREIVLAEIYFWSKHINEGGYFIFHDTHLNVGRNYKIAGKNWKTPDEAVIDFFNIPSEFCKGTAHQAISVSEYENDDIELKHYTEDYGMTFVKIKTLDAIERFKSGVDWDYVFEQRNWLMKYDSDTTDYLCDEVELVITV
tara:strand:- start:3306 stop:4058 length:753 start_codon:yes stop_codon:yes gene_type:complete